jgi:sortase A
MKIIVPRSLVTRLSWWIQITLLTAAAGMLGFCAFVLAEQTIFQHQAARVLDAPHPSSTAPILLKGAIAGELLGRMEIPRLGVSVIVAEGDDEATLSRAAGHIKETQMPGSPGNVGIAGHRDTLFRPLRDIRKDDVITLTTLQGRYRYRVVSTKIVSPYAVAVLQPDSHEILTLVTCYPFYFIGPAPDRFIVRAERVI